ncbi:MAG TPA: HAD-IIIA family hydrolase [bacterium]|nr:HAD-IIIA family hydrolase [bacterium]
MIQDKIKTRAQLVPICQQWRRQGFKIGFTSGAFDLIHAGHADYLEKAKALCDRLIVGVNTDISIKKYKGVSRPVIPELQRLKIVAALESVDFAFLFDERRNAANIKLLKPHFYFKAGDYRESELTSKPIIEKFGGCVKLIPIVEDISTSGIIRQIRTVEMSNEKFVEEQDRTVHLKITPLKSSPAIFLDRDGVINKEVGYLSDPDDFELLPNAVEGMKKFMDMGYRLVIVTNQGGIGLGYFSLQDFYQVNKKMLTQVSRAGILIDKIYFCPHSKAEDCPCRKPKTGLIFKAQEDLNLDLKNSYFVGDSPWDVEAGKNAGMHAIFIRNQRSPEPDQLGVKPDLVAADLLEAAQLILQRERGEEPVTSKT